MPGFTQKPQKSHSLSLSLRQMLFAFHFSAKDRQHHVGEFQILRSLLSSAKCVVQRCSDPRFTHVEDNIRFDEVIDGGFLVSLPISAEHHLPNNELLAPSQDLDLCILAEKNKKYTRQKGDLTKKTSA